MKKLILSVLSVMILIASSVNPVLASEVIILNDINDINLYQGRDGVYISYMEDGSFIRATIETKDVASKKNSTYATTYIQNKTYKKVYRKFTKMVTCYFLWYP